MINPMQFSLLENILTVLFLIAIVLWICYLCLRRRSNGAFRTQTGLVETEAVHQITFQDMEHPKKCVTLETDDTVFSTLKEGEQGKLVFRGSRLMSFGALQSQNHKDYKFKGIS